MGQTNEKKQKQGVMKRYWAVLVSLLMVFAMMSSAVGFAYVTLADGADSQLAQKQPMLGEEPGAQGDDELANLPERTTAMVLGVDENGFLADVQLLVTYDATKNRLDVISIPRDTYVDLPQSEVRAMQEAGQFCPNNGVMKINAVHSYAGKELGAEFAQRQHERMFGVEIDYYAIINVKAFRDIVDAVDGIWFEVRPEGYYYNPPDQELAISIPGGLRKLTGREAEGIVRFRMGKNGYFNGDLGRISVQQEFMKAFFEQVLSKETLVDSLPTMFASLVDDVKTNFGLDSVLRYLPAVKMLSGDHVHFHQAPGIDRTIDGVSYFLIDENEFAAMVGEVFDGVVAHGSDLQIQLLNGGAAVGVTAKAHEDLTAAGYNVVETGNYDGTEKIHTRILVREKEQSAGLIKHFPDAIVQVDEELPEAFDVVIILGQGQE